jgi:streptogramin lyase
VRWVFRAQKQKTIIKLNPQNGNFTQYNVGGNTVVDNAIINLAGFQLVFDNNRNILLFTDARTNSIGKLNISSGKVELVDIPTPKSGPMGIVLSQDGKSV